MLINKITTGFVIQTFDTEKGKFIKQTFFAGANGSDYEDMDGSIVGWQAMKEFNFGPLCEKEPYLLFEMRQPDEIEREKRDQNLFKGE